MNLGEVIATFRRKKNIKQGDLAKEVNITQSHLSLIERDKTHASIPTLTSIARALEIPVQLLVVYSLNSSQIDDDKKSAYYKIMPLIKEIIELHFLSPDKDRDVNEINHQNGDL